MWRWHDVCTVQRAGQATNPYTGEPEGEPDWADPTETVVSCSIQPRTSTEPGDGGAVVVGGWVGLLPAGTDLLHTDRIDWRGRLLEVDGDLAPVVFKGAVHHLEVPLKAWTA